MSNSHRRTLKLELGKTYHLIVAYATTAGEGMFSEALVVSPTVDMVRRKTVKVVAR